MGMRDAADTFRHYLMLALKDNKLTAESISELNSAVAAFEVASDNIDAMEQRLQRLEARSSQLSSRIRDVEDNSR